MSNVNGGASGSEQPTSRFGEVARGGADMFRRAFTIAAREELNQVKQQSVQALAPAAQSTGMIVGGGVLVTLGATYLLQAVVHALATQMPRWLASLLTGVALALGGVSLLALGRRQLHEVELLPHDDAPKP